MFLSQGLLPAIDELLPGVDQRYCVRHLYANFRKKFPGKQLKDLMWKAAKATYPQQWERYMQELRKVNEEAFRHLIKIPPRFWSRSRFSFNPKCDVLVNNMSETFNSVIIGPRTKPIVTMLEELRVYLMERWAENRRKVDLYEKNIMPRIMQKLKKLRGETKWWRVRYVTLFTFQNFSFKSSNSFK